MPDAQISALAEAVLEVISPDGSRRFVRIAQSPLLIGRGAETGNHIQLSDRRVSRQCAAVVYEGGRFYLEDRGQRRGLFVNGEKIESRQLEAGDVISFGLEDSYEIVFRPTGEEESVPNLLSRIESITTADSPAGGLRKLNLLLQATTLLHSQLPLDSVLGTMLDHTIAVTDADRGALLVPDDSGTLQVRLARRAGGTRLQPESITPSQTAVRLALAQRSPIITEDVAQGEFDLQAAQSIVAQRLRAVTVIPLYSNPRASSAESAIAERVDPARSGVANNVDRPTVANNVDRSAVANNIDRGVYPDKIGAVTTNKNTFLGVLYLDSRRPAAFSKLDRQILDALAFEAASVLDNARLVERERERQRLEQEFSIARDIQQAMLPHGFRDFPHLRVRGCNFPCHTVGGDYFDVFPLSEDRTAFLIADVSGKGLGAALLTTMLQGALSGMTFGSDPARVIQHVNRFLCEHAEVGRYATMFFGILDREGHLEFINAGHPSPILLRKGVAEAPFTEGSYPVGLVPDAQYVCARVKLEPGDTLVLFSDGVTEAMDPDEQLYGATRLREALCGKISEPLEQIQKCILESVENFTRGARQADDLTMLLVRYLAASATAGASPVQSASAAEATATGT